MNRFIIFSSLLAVVAVAEPEAKPWLLYGGLVGTGAHPAVAASASALTYANGAVVPRAPAVEAATAAHLNAKAGILASRYGYGLYGGWPYGAGLVYGRKKREADAEPEADPWLLYGGYYGAATHPAVAASPTALTYANGAVVPRHPANEAATAAHLAAKGLGYGYGLYGGWPYGYGAGLVYGRKKREAEAEPEADAEPWLHYGAYGYGYRGLGYGYGLPVGHPSGQDPITQGLDPVTQGWTGQYYYGRKKRDAEADAKPWLGYGYYGYPAATWGGLVAHPNGAVVPVDTPAVQLARAQHLGAKFGAYGFYYGKK